MKFRTMYDAGVFPAMVMDETVMTEQSHQDSCDINYILKKAKVSGMVDHVSNLQAQYGDFFDVQDYHTSLMQVEGAKALFDALPSKVRARFGNDPGAYLSFAQDPANLPEMVELGLAVKPVPVPSVVEDPKVSPA